MSADEAKQRTREAKAVLALLVAAAVFFVTLALVQLVTSGHPDNATLGAIRLLGS